VVKQVATCLGLIGSFLLAACTTLATSETTPPTSPGVTASNSPPSLSPAELAPITLTASLDEAPLRWTEVAFIPAGNAQSEVGFESCSDCHLPVPSALAVSKDGSFWIADPLKRRIAHFS
jgi:hypothetical protein